MGTKDRRNIEKENRREHILEVATRLMAQHGVHHLNIDMVAREAELAKGTIYLYFKSKEEIIGVLSTRSRLQLLRLFEAVAASADPPDEQLLQIIRVSYRFYTDNPLEYDLVSLYEGDNALSETPDMLAASQQITGLVAGIVSKAKAAGALLPGTDATLFTLNLWSMTFGVLRFIRRRGPLVAASLGLGEADIYAAYEDIIGQLLKKK